MNQKDGVFQAVSAAVGDISGKVELNKSQKEQVYAQLHRDFSEGKIEYRGEVNAEQLTKYIPGLVNNWLRKDERLNGGGKYVPKNPGSRAGSGDEAMKAMKTLLANTKDPEARAEITAEMERRAAELKPKKEINVAALPESLRKFVTQ